MKRQKLMPCIKLRPAKQISQADISNTLGYYQYSVVSFDVFIVREYARYNGKHI